MLELRDISKNWGQRPLLRQVSLRIAAGDTVALLGSSGSGKSTLLKIVAGLEPADAGSVWFDGVDITALPPEQRWQCALWQAILKSLTPEELAGARGAVLARVLAHLQSGQRPAQPLARRVVVFGLTHLPLSLLQLLAALAQHSQVLLAMPNP